MDIPSTIFVFNFISIIFAHTLNKNKMKDWTKAEEFEILLGELLSEDEVDASRYHGIDINKEFADTTVRELSLLSMGMEGYCGEDASHALGILEARKQEILEMV